MTDRERSDEELARTATAPGSEPTHAREAAPVGAELGRYRLQRELGRGGMGVVHAAFDPDLERRVALKVLRSADATEARQRLLREARAMARVTHANVVAVHEVGSADGRDYIAMDLIDGGTLEEWLASPHSEREILEAFTAAGRGLAAAHAAGLVHRDFKPHNILRRKDGGIVVTDFGLVVGIEGAADALTTTLQPGQASVDATGKDTPSSLSGLTATGSLLGTPAYMAPEQWTGGAVGPQTDQFAFCVALWEALARERPFSAVNINDLKADVCAGKHGDETKVPRRFRKILVRGLDPDPKKRWPSMTALLAALARADRKPWVAFALGGASLVAAVIVYAVATHQGGGAVCDKPNLDPDVVWTAHDAEQLGQKGQGRAAKAFERYVQAWTKLRAASCKLPPSTRDPQLTCLDGVLAHLELRKRGLLASTDPSPVEIEQDLIDPAVCAVARPPRLSSAESPEHLEVMIASINRNHADKPYTEADADALVARVRNEPCAAADAHGIAAQYKGGTARLAEIDEADRAAQACGDDRLIADVALFAIQSDIDVGTFDPQLLTSKIQKAETLVERVSQPDLLAELEMRRASVDVLSDRVDDGIQKMEHAIKLYKESHLVRTELNTSLQLVVLRERLAKPEDVAKVPSFLDELRARAVAALGEKDELVHTIDLYRAYWIWSSGDVVRGNAMFQSLVKTVPARKPIKVIGYAYNERGAPIAGADVVTGYQLGGDAQYAAAPRDAQQQTKTGADGRFEFAAAETGGVVIAQLGDLRSQPQATGEHVKLILEATSRLTGHAELHGRPAPTVVITASLKDAPVQLNYSLTAPVHADGSFEIAGVPRGVVQLEIVYNTTSSQMVNGITLDVEQPTMTGVQLDALARKRSIYVLVRSTVGAGVPNAQIFVVPDKFAASQSLKDIRVAIQNAVVKIARPVQGEKLPADVVAKSKPEDLYVLVDAPDGDASACAIGLPAHIDDPEFQKASAKLENLAKIMVECVPVSATDTAVVVEVPPWPRLD